LSTAERLVLALIALAVFLPGIASRDLWNPDEPRYAEVAREMRVDGEWLVPHLNGRIYAEKPPLQFWSIATFSYLTGGVGPVAARLPAILSVVAATLLVADMAAKLFELRVAWWAALIFLSSAKILWQGRIGQIDMLLIALVTAAMAAFVRGYVDDRPGSYRWFWVFTGLATLAKGPVGLLPPLLSILVWAFATGQRRVLRELRIGGGLVVWAAVVLLWFVPAAVSGGREYFETMLFKQNVGRFADPWHHFRPWYYYLGVIPGDFFPWSLFLPGALWVGARRIFGRRRRGVTLAMSWMLVTLAFFSLSPAKRTVYILTMYPAMALLVAAAFAEIESSWPRFRRLLTVPAGLAALLVGGGTLAGAILLRTRSERFARQLAELEPMGPGLIPLVGFLGLVLAFFLTAGWIGARRRHPGGTVLAFAGGMSFLVVLASIFVLPRFDAVKSARPLAEKLLELSRPGDPYAIWPRLDPTFLVHTRRYAVELEDEAELRAWASREARPWLVIRKDVLEKLDPPLPLVEVARDAEVRQGYALLGPPSGG